MTTTPKINDICENDKTKESTGSAPKACIRRAVTSRTQEDDWMNVSYPIFLLPNYENTLLCTIDQTNKNSSEVN